MEANLQIYAPQRLFVTLSLFVLRTFQDHITLYQAAVVTWVKTCTLKNYQPTSVTCLNQEFRGMGTNAGGKNNTKT